LISSIATTVTKIMGHANGELLVTTFLNTILKIR